jgi:hypothetical protein
LGFFFVTRVGVASLYTECKFYALFGASIGTGTVCHLKINIIFRYLHSFPEASSAKPFDIEGRKRPLVVGFANAVVIILTLTTNACHQWYRHVMITHSK